MIIELTDNEVDLLKEMLETRLSALSRQLDPEWRSILKQVRKQTAQEDADLQVIVHEEIGLCRNVYGKIKAAAEQPQPCPLSRL